MHPTTEQLLSYRDAPEDAFIATHLEQCRGCAAELQELSRTRAALQGLPQLDAPNAAWMRIQAAASVPATSGTRSTKLRVRTALAFALAAGVASLAVLLVLRNANESPGAKVEPRLQVAVPKTQRDNDVASLIAQSRELDVLLHRLPERPRVERVSTAATLDTIEERIQWLDFQLSYAAAGELDETQAQRLWRERVELMDSLVKVRYAQSGRASF
jgi:hypothetical protein